MVVTPPIEIDVLGTIGQDSDADEGAGKRYAPVGFVRPRGIQWLSGAYQKRDIQTC